MKKFLVLFFIFFLCFNVYGQLTVFDPMVHALLTISEVDSIARWIQTGVQWAKELANSAVMIKNLEEQVKKTAQNLRSAKDIRSWDDFTDFYNRQLYLEKMTMQAFNNVNVKIGSEEFHILDIEGIAQGIESSRLLNWYDELPPEERKAMWLELGLTPSNYAYVMPYRAKALEIAREGLVARDVVNDWYVRNISRSNERQLIRAKDKYADDDDKMGEKEVLMHIAESLDESNKVLNDVAMQNAQMLELQAVDYYLKKTPKSNPVFSEWSDDGFRPLVFDKK